MELFPGVSNNEITIKGFRDNSNIVFSIKDNGTGISSDRLDKLKADLAEVENKPSSSIGLVNVNERLRIIYGDKYGLNIESSPGSGTSVNITIPALKKEEVTRNA